MVSVQPALTHLWIVVLNSSIIAQYESSICFLLEHQLLSYSSYSDSQHTTFNQVISFSACVCAAASDSLRPHGLWLTRFLCPWTFQGKEYWSGLPFPIPGDLPDPGIEPISPVLVGVFFTTEPWGKPWESSKQSSNFRCHSVVRWNSSLFSLTGLDALDLEVSVAKHHCGHCLGLWSDHPEAQLAWSGWGTPSAQTV